jgi:hypothetical protein
MYFKADEDEFFNFNEKETMYIELLITDESAMKFNITNISDNEGNIILTVSDHNNIINSGLGKLFKFEVKILGGNSGIWLIKEGVTK